MSVVFISVNYRLPPEHGYPSQYDNGLDVLKFLDQTPTPSLTSPTSLAASSLETVLAPTSRTMWWCGPAERVCRGSTRDRFGCDWIELEHYPVDYRFVLRSSTAGCHMPSISVVHHFFLPPLSTTVV
ncbi:hypothetical protein ACLB2K_019356 [Fragaria x ananassa]